MNVKVQNGIMKLSCSLSNTKIESYREYCNFIHHMRDTRLIRRVLYYRGEKPSKDIDSRESGRCFIRRSHMGERGVVRCAKVNLLI